MICRFERLDIGQLIIALGIVLRVLCNELSLCHSKYGETY